MSNSMPEVLPGPMEAVASPGPLSSVCASASFHIQTDHGPQFIDITEKVQAVVDANPVAFGMAVVYSRHTTAAVKINENEPLLIADMCERLTGLFPPSGSYGHNDFSIRTVNMTDDEQPNGHSHCQHLLLSTSETVPIVGASIALGRWQRIFLVELDRARPREVVVTIFGLPAGVGGQVVPAAAAPPVRRVLLAQPRGFCAGVEMAIKSLAWMVQRFGPPVYCYHEIVHNKSVVERFRSAGVVFVDDVAEVPPGAPLMLSAHGSAPEVVRQAHSRGSVVIDAACPLVTKVHHEVKLRASRGYSIVYLGHQGHDEAVSTMAVAPEAIHLVEDEGDVARLEGIEGPVAFVTQTTLAADEWSRVARVVQDRFPEVWTPDHSDLCFATTNRQTAVAAIARRSDAVVVIGSANSSNTRSLERVARDAGCLRVYRIDGVDELPTDLAGTVGVTAGASAPEDLVRQVVAALAPVEGVEMVDVGEEREYFPLPPELRQFLPEEATAADRQTRASDVLDELLPRAAHGAVPPAAGDAVPVTSRR